MQNILIALASLTLLGACTSPVIKSDSISSRKQIAFPSVGKPSTATAGNPAALYADYQSQQVYQLTQPFHAFSLLVGPIEVAPVDRLLESELQGETVYCSEGKVLTSTNFTDGKACFKSSRPGKFDTVTYASGATWQTKKISPEIDFTSRESLGAVQKGPMKRELVYDGSQGNSLMFSERIYEKALEKPSVVKPLVATVGALPAAVTLDGMELNIIRYDARTVTFEVTRHWQ